MDGAPSVTVTQANETATQGNSKPYLIFLSSITNKLCFINLECFKTTKVKFENIITNQKKLSENILKKLDKKTAMKSLKNLLYNNSMDNEEEDFDDANSNKIR